MDELKILVDMVAHLPQMALWVLVGFLVYKLAVIGSMYGLARFGIDKLHDYLTKRKQISMEVLLDGISFDTTASKDDLIKELRRLMFIGKPEEYKANSIHKNWGVALLRQAIDRMYEENPMPKK